MYGVRLADQWAGCNLDEVKAAWDEALSGLAMDEVRRGLVALVHAGKPFPPTLPEFYVLCRPPFDIPPESDHAALDRMARTLGITHLPDTYHALRQEIIRKSSEARSNVVTLSKQP